MSVFDQDFNEPSGCFGILNGNEHNLSPILAIQNPQDTMGNTRPEDRQKMREVDDLLSHAMKALTFDERQEQQDILHGVHQKVDEEETFVNASLQQLDSEIERTKSGSIYQMAEQMDPSYVRSKSFRSMFLRANQYNAKEAAENMLKFFEMKRQLFGAKKLVKDITLDDLDANDIETLKSGYLQFAGKDNAGRSIVINIPGLRGNMSLQNELRMRYYLLMSVLEENPRSNRVGIVYSVGDMKDRFGGRGFFEAAQLGMVIPHYRAAGHMCINGVTQYLMQKTILKAMPLKMRSRCKIHFGSQTECLYQLSTYGIPQDVVPLDPRTGRICLKRHLQWVESRFVKERCGRLPPITSAMEPISGILHPHDNDVLVGTGKKSNNVGNRRLRALVKDWSAEYVQANTIGRRDLVTSVINSIQESGGRFLKDESVDGWNVVWHEMPKDEIRKNVTQAFRNSYRRRKTGNA